MTDSAQPGTLSKRRQRLSDDQTRDQMIHAGKALVTEHGLTVSVEHLSFEEIIQDARVSRSAVYRLWPSKDLYFSDLLADLSGTTNPNEAAYDHSTVQLVAQETLSSQALLSSPEGRRALLVELCRRGARQNFRTLYGAPEWQTYVALTATLVSLPNGSLQTKMQHALHGSETRFVERMAVFYETMGHVLGFRIRQDVPNGFEMLATLGGAIIEGLALNAVIMPTVADDKFNADPFDTGQAAEWTTPSLGFTSLVLGLLEPDSAYDPSRLGRLEEILDQLLTTHNK